MMLGQYKHVWFPHSPLHACYCKVYCLKDCEGVVFYIGITQGELTRRLAGHLNEAFNDKAPTNYYKNQIIRDNEFMITIHEIERKWCTGSSGYDIMRKCKHLEDKWIRHYIAIGYGLSNVEFKKSKGRIPTSGEYKVTA